MLKYLIRDRGRRRNVLTRKIQAIMSMVGFLNVLSVQVHWFLDWKNMQGDDLLRA